MVCMCLRVRVRVFACVRACACMCMCVRARASAHVCLCVCRGRGWDLARHLVRPRNLLQVLATRARAAHPGHVQPAGRVTCRRSKMEGADMRQGGQLRLHRQRAAEGT